MWDASVVVSEEETGDGGKLRAESATHSNEPEFYLWTRKQLWSAGHAASDSAEGLLALQSPGPCPQIF